MLSELFTIRLYIGLTANKVSGLSAIAVCQLHDGLTAQSAVIIYANSFPKSSWLMAFSSTLATPRSAS